jgi:hypothetical protein
MIVCFLHRDKYFNSYTLGVYDDISTTITPITIQDSANYNIQENKIYITNNTYSTWTPLNDEVLEHKVYIALDKVLKDNIYYIYDVRLLNQVKITTGITVTYEDIYIIRAINHSTSKMLITIVRHPVSTFYTYLILSDNALITVGDYLRLYHDHQAYELHWNVYKRYTQVEYSNTYVATNVYLKHKSMLKPFITPQPQQPASYIVGLQYLHNIRLRYTQPYPSFLNSPDYTYYKLIHRKVYNTHYRLCSTCNIVFKFNSNLGIRFCHKCNNSLEPPFFTYKAHNDFNVKVILLSLQIRLKDNLNHQILILYKGATYEDTTHKEDSNHHPILILIQKIDSIRHFESEPIFRKLHDYHT